MKHPCFICWNETKRRTLWISGGSGCGKTIAIAYLISQLTKRDDIQVLYRFSTRSSTGLRDHPADVIRSFLFQLWKKTETDPGMTTFWADIQAQVKNVITMDDKYWKELLAEAAHNFSRLYSREIMLVWDAVDECEDGEKLLNWFIEFMGGQDNLLRQGSPIPRVRLLASSRLPNIALEHLLKGNEITMDDGQLSKNYSDILHMVHTRLHEGIACGELAACSEEFIKDIATTIAWEAQGM